MLEMAMFDHSSEWYWMWSNGMVEWWGLGIVEWWNDGILSSWNSGIVE